MTIVNKFSGAVRFYVESIGEVAMFSENSDRAIHGSKNAMVRELEKISHRSCADENTGAGLPSVMNFVADNSGREYLI